MIDNLTTVLETVAERDQHLSGLIVSLQQFVTGLSGDREAIFDSLETIDDLAGATGGCSRTPPAAGRRHRGARRSAGNLTDTGDVLEDFLQLAPTKIDLTRDRVNG